jgi:acyl-CoA synthetase (AMP-forming)/AMP-acid ligase II
VHTADTIPKLIERGGALDAALAAPGRKALNYEALRALNERTAHALRAMGIGVKDRIAIVLPNGPEMASAFLAVAGMATAAPLNPGYRESEFDFYLSALNAKALLILEGMESPARAVASARRIPIIEVETDSSKPAGGFTLKSFDAAVTRAASSSTAGPDDIALVLHTSGTTSRPKIVPLSHRNVTASAVNIVRILRLTREDVCLNIMPLFHIHGLIGAVLSSIAAGASIACAPNFDALKFFRWFAEVNPTWYTAVPTMHQTILGRAARNAEIIAAAGRLRLIRSSSSSLPPQVMAELEKVFRVPVLESYGMTEAAHQMASNPLPPGKRFAGSVGIASGPEIAIMNDAGDILKANDIGEVVIRGRDVFAGYENNPEANAKAWTNGWFRTGDQGYLDAAGYLRLTGRLKEMINRGGEKISPLEVETTLMSHPLVAQAVAFAIADPMLGEEVAAAVVLRDGANPDEHELREFVSVRIAHFKVPRKIVFLDAIPKGPTGKPRRIGLAKVLGLET